MSQFTYKLTTESELFSFDFNPVLQANESIDTASCTMVTQQGTDEHPEDMLSGLPVISLGKATQRIEGGLSDNIYRAIMTVVTNHNNTYTCVGDIPVYSPESI